MLGDALSTLNAQFNYRLMNLCVKAEPVSLLSVEALIEGEYQKLEACAQVGLGDDYSFKVVPNYDGDIPTIAQAIYKVHPEFKQQMKTMQVDVSTDESKQDLQDVHYILVTMPEVDDNRYDVLKDGVKAIYDENNAQKEGVAAKADAKFIKFIVGESEADVEKLKEARDKQMQTWKAQRDQIYNDKIQEIEKAHEKWLVNQVEQRIKNRHADS